MSYKTWTEYGYGICTDDLKKEIKLDRLLKLIKMAPTVNKRIQEFISSECEEEVEIYDILVSYVEDYGDINFGGLAEILHEVILELEGIDLYVCTDYDGACYLIYLPDYPWNIQRNEKEKNLDEETLCNIFGKYLHIVTDEIIKVDYRAVKNGC